MVDTFNGVKIAAQMLGRHMTKIIIFSVNVMKLNKVTTFFRKIGICRFYRPTWISSSHTQW